MDACNKKINSDLELYEIEVKIDDGVAKKCIGRGLKIKA